MPPSPDHAGRRAADLDPGREPANLHASAVVIGTACLLITGPSGAGKSQAAFALLAEARAAGLFAALVADDQVLLSAVGGRVVTERPAAIAGLIELRGSGIAAVPTVAAAVATLVLAPAEPSGAGRLPEAGEEAELPRGMRLPLVRIDLAAPALLARLAALHPSLLHN